MLKRLLTLVRKELLLLLREPQSRRLLLLPVILQLALFPFAASLEVRNSTLGIFNEDSGQAAAELVQRLARTEAFPLVLMVHSDRELARVVDGQQVLLALRFPADFSRALESRRTATVQAVLDGRRSNSAQIAFAYASQVVDDYAAERGRAEGRAPASAILVRNVFNPNLVYRWFILPALVAIITTLGSLIVTALSVAREREQGTLDQLLVSPLTPGLIIVGKVIPAVLVALVQASIISLAAVFVYGLPFQNPVALLYLGLLCYALSLAGFGIFISALCNTQQQAFLGVFAFMVPAIMLSGFTAPVENMPRFLQVVTLADPLRHFIPLVRALFLKHVGFGEMWTGLWPLLAIASVTLSSGYWMFRRRAMA